MQVLRGNDVETVEPDAAARRVREAERVVVDVGTGDARWAYRLAKANPAWLVIGIDPARDRMKEIAQRLPRKPAKGGIDNLWLVASDVERAPEDLHGVADEVHVLLPWGSLLRGAVLGQPDLLRAVARLGRDGATVTVVLGADIWDDPIPVDVRDLPTVDLDYVHDTLTDRYAAAGLGITGAERLRDDEWKALPSSWTRRLAHGRREPKFVRIVATVGRAPSVGAKSPP